MKKFDVYKSLSDESKFLVVEHKTDEGKVNQYGASLQDKDFHSLQFYKKVDVTNQPAIGLDDKKASEDIKERGFHLSSPKIIITEGIN